MSRLIRGSLLVLVIFFGHNAHSEIHRDYFAIPNIAGRLDMVLEFDIDNECYEEIEYAIDTTNSYLNSVSRLTAKEAKEKEDKLLEYQNQVRPKCLAPFLEITTILSAFHLHGGLPRDQHIRMIQFLAIVQRSHIIRPLTQEIRNQHKILQNPRIMGAYYCAENVIWIDPTKAPLNKATVLMHELEHWAMALLQTEFDQTSLAGRKLYLFDEFVSALNPAMTQLSLRSNFNRRKSNNTKPTRQFYFDYKESLGVGWNKPKPKFQTQSDLNLYSDDGILIRSWNKVIKEKGLDKAAGFQHFLVNDFMTIEMEGKSSALALLEMIERIYFGEVTIQSTEVLNKIIDDQKFLNTYLNPLEQILSKDNSWWQGRGRPKCGPGSGPFPGGEGGAMSDDRVKLMNSGIKACYAPDGKL